MNFLFFFGELKVYKNKIQKGNCENFTTVRLTYLCIKIQLEADNELEGREKMHTISGGLKALQDGRAGRAPRVKILPFDHNRKNLLTVKIPVLR